MRIDEPGVYRVILRSDDGSRLSIDGEGVVNNDGLHAAVERESLIALGEGWHAISVEWFNRTGGAELSVRLGRVDAEARAIAPDRLRSRN